MKAAWYTSNGSAREVLTVGELPTPEPGPGEVRVRLATSGVNPSDVKSRRGAPPAFPRIVPHSDGGGVIDAVGDGVPAGRVGERVWIWNGQWKRALGTAAEFVALPSDQAVRLPDNVDFAAAACLGIPALTALQGVRLLGPLAGRTILVTGASSAVGHYVTQMAARAGARVIGTVGSAAKAAHARAAGAAETIAYKTEDLAARVRDLTGGRGVDGVIDMDFSTTGPLLAKGLVAPHGTLAVYGSNVPGDNAVPFRPCLWTSVTIRFFLVYDLTPDDRRETLAALTGMLAGDQLIHTVGARFPLSEIAAAHEAVEAGATIGNIVIDL
jgi:NADPH2:quinone reductase